MLLGNDRVVPCGVDPAMCICPRGLVSGLVRLLNLMVTGIDTLQRKRGLDWSQHDQLMIAFPVACKSAVPWVAGQSLTRAIPERLAPLFPRAVLSWIRRHDDSMYHRRTLYNKCEAPMMENSLLVSSCP